MQITSKTHKTCNICATQETNHHCTKACPQQMRQINPTNQNNMREKYINFIKNFKYTQQYITDKAPLNFRWIGFINLIFPNTKIIHCTRDPKNNCLSMFKNLFEGGLNFTYSQEDLVKYYKNYQDLMNLGMNVEVRHSGKLFEVASTMLKNAVEAKNAKLEKKLRMVELQLKKQRVDQMGKTGDSSTDIVEGEGYVVGDRNELLKQILDRVDNDKKDK